jgi:hypothetical protein
MEFISAKLRRPAVLKRAVAYWELRLGIED